MSSEDYGLVESILASVQWDRWQFMLSTRKLCEFAAVLSHGDGDHKDPALKVQTVFVPKEMERLVPARLGVKYVENQAVHGQLLLSTAPARVVGRVLKMKVPKLHAIWWVVSTREREPTQRTAVLFVGDLNRKDIELVYSFCEAIVGRAYPLKGVLLPSFGGLKDAHGSAGDPLLLCEEVAEVAFKLKGDFGMALGALPHPVPAEWADHNATSLYMPTR